MIYIYYYSLIHPYLRRADIERESAKGLDHRYSKECRARRIGQRFDLDDLLSDCWQTDLNISRNLKMMKNAESYIP